MGDIEGNGDGEEGYFITAMLTGAVVLAR